MMLSHYIYIDFGLAREDAAICQNIWIGHQETMEKSLENSELIKVTKTISSKQSILVIDDNSDTLNLNRIILELDGYEVFTAECGIEALEILSEINEPNLILLDMQMPDMSGLEFLTILEEKIPAIIKDVPVVFLTGMDVVPKSKAVGFIRKPADRVKLLKDIRSFIELGCHPPYRH